MGPLSNNAVASRDEKVPKEREMEGGGGGE